MSECGRCMDRRLVGGFLPSACPKCAGGPTSLVLTADDLGVLEWLADQVEKWGDCGSAQFRAHVAKSIAVLDRLLNGAE